MTKEEVINILKLELDLAEEDDVILMIKYAISLVEQIHDKETISQKSK